MSSFLPVAGTCRRAILFVALLGLLALPVAATASGTKLRACSSRPGETLELKGTVRRGGLDGTFRRVVASGSGRSAETTDFQVFRTGRGFDGHLAWSRDASGATHDLDSGFARELAISEAWLAVHRGCGLPAAGEAEHLAPTAEGFDAWRVTPAGGAPVEIWYAAATGLPDREILQYPESHLVRHLADWRDVGHGRMIPFTQDEEDPEDEETAAFRVQGVSFHASAAPVQFQRPPVPDDVRFSGRFRTTTLPYEDDHRTRVYVPVYLNGTGPYVFEIDSGGHFILGADTAKALRLTVQGSLSSTGAGEAIAKAGYARVREVKVGEATLLGQPVKVLQLSAASNDRGARPPRAGILGLEFFERFIVRLDRRAKTVTLTSRTARGTLSGAQAVPIVFAEDAPLVAGSFRGVPGDFMLDTGNAGASIVEHFWADRHGLTPVMAAGPSVGSGVSVTRGDLQLGRLLARDEVLNYYGPVKRGSEYTRAVAVVLGEPMLSRFDCVYDYGRKTVWLKPVEGLSALPFNRAGILVARLGSGELSVARVLDRSAAAEAGVKVNDILDSADGSPAKGLSRADVGALFQQPAGTIVRLGLREPTATEVRIVELRLRESLGLP